LAQRLRLSVLHANNLVPSNMFVLVTSHQRRA
jgi:hypothetical protein